MEGLRKAGLPEVKRFVLRRAAPASINLIPIVVSYSKKNMKRISSYALHFGTLVIISFLKVQDRSFGVLTLCQTFWSLCARLTARSTRARVFYQLIKDEIALPRSNTD